MLSGHFKRHVLVETLFSTTEAAVQSHSLQCCMMISDFEYNGKALNIIAVHSLCLFKSRNNCTFREHSHPECTASINGVLSTLCSNSKTGKRITKSGLGSMNLFGYRENVA